MNAVRKSFLIAILFIFGVLLLVVGLLAPFSGYELPYLQSEPKDWITVWVYVKFADGSPVEGAQVDFLDYPYPSTKFTDVNGFCSDYIMDIQNGDVVGKVRVQYESYSETQNVQGAPESIVQVYFVLPNGEPPPPPPPNGDGVAPNPRTFVNVATISGVVCIGLGIFLRKKT